ncbi:hypothetical protein [Enterococcus faecalis]|uniref:hypothetical protein n=1 Tax=Enterococcus faecalis TaxID=1351 RepID=UPI000331005F|nr:hypothetical protein [Enterococcus faecalis]EOE35774.1 hypothetical protein QAG_03256 [Enterococcus faecalis EnGen0067]
MKVTNTIRFEEEKKNLIDNVVNTLEEYKGFCCKVEFRECKIFCVNEKIHTKKEVASVE